MQLYSREGLPLQKIKNKYVINKNELDEWIKQKEEKEKKLRNQVIIFNCIGTFVLLIMMIISYVLFKTII